MSKDFRGVPIPQPLLAHFAVRFTPSSLLAHEPELWEAPEIQAAIATLRRLEKDPDPAFRWRKEWAERELTAALEASRGRERRGPNPGKDFDREVSETFDEVEKFCAVLSQKRPGYRVSLGRPDKKNTGSYRSAPLLGCPPSSLLGEFDPTKLEDVYRIVARIHGLSDSNAKKRISRRRDVAGTRRLPFRRRGPSSDRG